MVWKSSNTGMFTVSSMYSLLRNEDSTKIGLSELIWNNVAPHKVQFFGWLCWKERVKTAPYLQRIGVLSGQVNVSCLFCEEEEESLNHVLMYCPKVWRVWSDILNWWGIKWAIPGSIQSLLLWWQGARFKNLDRKLWDVLPFAVLWSIWKVRNLLRFEGIQPKWVDVCETIKIRTALWVKFNCKWVSYTVNDFVKNLHLIRGMG